MLIIYRLSVGKLRCKAMVTGDSYYIWVILRREMSWQLLVTFTKNYRPYSVKTRPLFKEYNSLKEKKKSLLKSFYFVPGSWLSSEVSEKNKIQS